MQKRSRLDSAVILALGMLALLVPALAGWVLVDQSRTPLLGIYVDDAVPPHITQAMAGSAAARSGLAAGDTILTVDGRPYAAWLAAPRQIGQHYRFDLLREGSAETANAAMGSVLQATGVSAGAALVVALAFWAAGVILLSRRVGRSDVRVLFLLYQACAVCLLLGLAYPRFLLPAPWMVTLSVAALIFAGPLLLHYQISYPVMLGEPAPRHALLGALYALALLGAWWAARRPSPWSTVPVFASLAVGLLAFGVMVFVYLRGAGLRERRRMRVGGVGAVVGLGVPLVAYVLPTVIAGYSPPMPRWFVSLFLLLIPLSALYAVARHDLFDIDRLINRAIVYGALALTVFALYLAAFFVLYRFMPERRLAQVTVLAGLSVFIGLTFQPARMRIQKIVDRLFYAGWYDYPDIVEHTTAGLAHAREWDAVANSLTVDAPQRMSLSGAVLEVGARRASTLPASAQPQVALALECGTQARGMLALSPGISTAHPLRRPTAVSCAPSPARPRSRSVACSCCKRCAIS